jgi:MFS family permease
VVGARRVLPGRDAALITLFEVATSLGGLFAAIWGTCSPGGLGSALALCAVLLLALPNNPASFAKHGAALFVMGFMASWNTSATNSPILAEIVPPRSRTTVFALDRTFEAVLASFAPPVVGLLAERIYGYKLVRPAAGGAEHAASVETDRHNATSLARALYTAIAIPMALCCLVYSFLYCTYPTDRDLARAETAREGGGARPGGDGSDSDDEGEDERKLLPQ